MRAAGAAGLVVDCQPVYGDALNLRMLVLTGWAHGNQNGPARGYQALNDAQGIAKASDSIRKMDLFFGPML